MPKERENEISSQLILSLFAGTKTERIKELSKESGINSETLRKWELDPDRALAHLHLTYKIAKAAGKKRTAKEIKDLIELCGGQVEENDDEQAESKREAS